MRKPFTLVAILLAALSTGAGTATAKGTQPPEKTAEICSAQTAAVEREMGIPHGLLGAISLAETGRWDADRQASFAWPWTVTAEGRGRYFDSKAEAIAAVRRLQADGISNIDVGCMQINLYYHGEAFTDLEEALDPATNATYAGQYLRDLEATAGSWTVAAGYYHSMTPDRGDAYRERVLALWDGTKESAPEPASAPAENAVRTAPPTPQMVSIDMARTAELNARLRVKRAAEREAGFVSRRRTDLAYWREARAANLDTGHLAAARRAQAAAARQREFHDVGLDRSDRFAKRRRAQLKRWRLSVNRDDPSS